MPYPSGNVPTSNLDSGSDSPNLARGDLLNLVQQFNDLVAMRGVALGFPSLDAAGLVPAGQLPSTIPPGATLDYAGPTPPVGWLLCDGSAVSRTTYAALFTAIGTTWGAGDGSTTFNLPDLRDRTTVGRGDMGGTNAQRLTVVLNGTTTAGSAVITGLSSTAGLAIGMQVIGSTIPTGRTIASIDSATQVTLNSGTSVTAGTVSLRFAIIDGITLGAVGGAGVHTLVTAEMPAHTHAQTGNTGQATSAGSFSIAGTLNTLAINNTQSTGGSRAHPNVQPSAVMNKIIKT